MNFLKQSTTVTITLGPFVDKTDGVTEETGLAGTMTVYVSKAGGIFAARNSATAITHDAGLSGHYRVELNTTDTGTVGPLKVGVQSNGTHLPVWQEYTILPANAYDSIVAGSDYLDINAFQWAGSATATNDVALATAPSNFTDLAITSSTGKITVGTNDDKTGYSISGTKTTLDALNDVSTAQVNTEVDTALADVGLDHLISSALPTSWATDVASGSVFDNIADNGTAAFDRTTDSLQAIRDNQVAATDIVSSGAITTSGGAVSTVTTLTGHTAQTGDTYALANGAQGFAAIDTVVDTINTNVGTNGDGLTNMPWNASWDAEVQSECNDALVALNLDHLLAASATGVDVVDESIIAQLVSKSATADWDSYDNATDSLEAILDTGESNWLTGGGGTNPFLLQSTTITGLVSQTSFNLTAGSTDDDAYIGCLAIITDASTSTQKAVGVISDYVGSTKTITLLNDPGIFTMADTDGIDIIADKALKPAVDNRTLLVDASGAIENVTLVATTTTNTDMRGTDSAALASDYTSARAGYLDNINGHTAQTGDTYALASGANGFANIKTDTASILVDTADMQPKLGTPAGADMSADIAAVKAETANILTDTGTTLDGKLDVIDGIVDSILVDTAEIGTAGAGLTNVPWNASWDAEVQSEVDDGLTAFFTSSAQLVDDIWDEAITNSVHNGANAAGKLLRQTSKAYVVHDGTAQTGSSNTITLAAGASATNDFYVNRSLTIIDGTSAGETGLITGYNGTTKVATMDKPWITTPDNTSEYTVTDAHAYSASDHNTIHQGYAQAGGATSITLSTDASSVDDFYNGMGILIESGTSAGLSNIISDYNGATKVATVKNTWITNPDSTSVYHVHNAKVNAVLIDTNALSDINAEADTAIADAALATAANLATVDTNVDAILVDTAEIGVAGAGLTDIGGFSTAAKAEINAECDTAIADWASSAIASASTLASHTDYSPEFILLKMIKALQNKEQVETSGSTVKTVLKDDDGTTDINSQVLKGGAAYDQNISAASTDITQKAANTE